MNDLSKSGAWLRIVTLVTIALAMPMMTACASRSTVISNPVEIDTSEYDRIFQASADILRDNGFRLDRQDHRFGVLTSHPRPSPTALEPWHRDNTTLGQVAQSTANYQRRRVVIRLIPAPAQVANAESDSPAASQPADDADPQASAGHDSYLLEAQVIVEQVEAPRRYLTGSTGQGRMVRQFTAMPSELAEKQVTRNYWRPVGRDTPMEQRLVADILRRSLTIARTRARQADAP